MALPLIARAEPPAKAQSRALQHAGQRPAAPAARSPGAGKTAATEKTAADRAAAAKQPIDKARALFEQGVAAYDAGKHIEAERLFTAAFSLQRSWDIAANLGVVERKLHKDVEAAEHLSIALATLPPSESDRTRATLGQELAGAAAKVGKLTIQSDVAGAEVRVGGRLRGTTPLEGPVFAAPGSVQIEITKDGFDVAAKQVEVTAGGAATVSLSPARKARAERPVTGPAIAFGAAGLGLLTGLIAGGLAAAKMDGVRSACGEDLVCPTSLHGEVEVGRAAGHVATAGFVTAGALAAVGLSLLLVPDRSAAPGKGAPPKIGFTARPGLVGVTGTF